MMADETEEEVTWYKTTDGDLAQAVDVDEVCKKLPFEEKKEPALLQHNFCIFIRV